MPDTTGCARSMLASVRIIGGCRSASATPGIKEFVQPYVLQNFPDGERTLWVAPLLAAIVETIPLLVAGAPDAFMSEVARRFSPPNEDAPEGPAEG